MLSRSLTVDAYPEFSLNHFRNFFYRENISMERQGIRIQEKIFIRDNYVQSTLFTST